MPLLTISSRLSVVVTPLASPNTQQARDCILQYTIKFFSAILPIVAALFVSNLVYVLKYAGITGFFICFLFPTALQLRSIWVCSREFESRPVTVKMKVPPLRGGEGGENEKTKKSEMARGGWKKLTCGFRSLRKRLSLMFVSYQTPYSSRFLSHPLVVCLIGGIGVALFLLGVCSLAVHPTQSSVEMSPNK